MIKTCILAFGSGVLFFLLILQSAWWLVPGVLTWGVIFYLQDRRSGEKSSDKRSR